MKSMLLHYFGGVNSLFEGFHGGSGITGDGVKACEHIGSMREARGAYWSKQEGTGVHGSLLEYAGGHGSIYPVLGRPQVPIGVSRRA